MSSNNDFRMEEKGVSVLPYGEDEECRMHFQVDKIEGGIDLLIPRKGYKDLWAYFFIKNEGDGQYLYMNCRNQHEEICIGIIRLRGEDE